MAQDALAALNVAIGELEIELGENPRFALLTQLRSARDAYMVASEGNLFASGVPRVTVKRVEAQRTLSPDRAKAYELCKKALVGHTVPVRTRDLYEMIEENGVSLAGGSNNLSSLLSRHPQTFKGHGRAGWTLKDIGNGAEPDSGANGEGSAPLSSSSREGGEVNEATTTQH
ncbi:hypothetical protein [Sphingomonas sp. SRS2]|uniref:hypothetical protein n=1 Tax=Sphingomonas sp. SRS2 TaxID=133190 RepID=UPI00061845C7|nr:hypothetical protein [Sphingomonas sp. SRS2]KKC27969.1 hypothetical protein WP12_00370 [Sphingomonas sp. SRS2]